MQVGKRPKGGTTKNKITTLNDTEDQMQVPNGLTVLGQGSLYTDSI